MFFPIFQNPPFFSRVSSSLRKAAFLCAALVFVLNSVQICAGSESASDAKAERLPTIFSAGDSTMANYSPSPSQMAGWMQVLNEFTVEGVTVQNHAVGGASTKSFIDSGRWDRLIQQVQPGDFVILQFGHNDQKKYSKTAYAEAHTDYKKNLTRFVQEVREKGGNPILATSITRRLFEKEEEGAKLRISLNEYPECLREAAGETNTPLVDLYVLTREMVEKAGPEGSWKYYSWLDPGQDPKYPDGLRDRSHLQRGGALAVADLFVKEARRQNLPIAEFFKKGE